MFRAFIILYVLLVFTTSVNAIYNKPNSQRKLKSGTKIYLNKCCPSGTCVGKRKVCGNHNVTLTLSKIKVYDEDIYLSRKSFEDLFALIPNKFNDTAFKDQNVIDVKALDLVPYLTESGVLQLELPNAYDRWRTIPKDSYCIDLDYGKGEEPRFWAILQEEEDLDGTSGNIITTIATILSCFFMLLVLLVYALLPELRNLHGLILMAYIFSLLIAFSLLAVLQIDTISNEACLGVASAIYFFFLAAFCWMSVMSYDVWWTFRSYIKHRLHRNEDHVKFLMYCLYACGVPLLLTIGLVVVNTYKEEMRRLPWFVTPGIPEKGCFLKDGVQLLYFYLPMLILIICNWMFYLMTAFNIWKWNKGTAVLDSTAAENKQAHRAQKDRLMVYLKLSVVMGLTWLLEIISFLWPGYKLWFLSDAYNSLIGLAMFLIFVCKKNIWHKLCRRYGEMKIVRWLFKSTSRNRVPDSSQEENITLQSTVTSQPNGLYG